MLTPIYVGKVRQKFHQIFLDDLFVGIELWTVIFFKQMQYILIVLNQFLK